MDYKFKVGDVIRFNHVIVTVLVVYRTYYTLKHKAGNVGRYNKDFVEDEFHKLTKLELALL